MPSISARSVLAQARRTIGTREHGSNLTPFGVLYGLNGVSWCGIWVYCMFLLAGIDLRNEGIAAAASTNAFDAAAGRQGWQAIPKTKAQPGDVVFYDFGDLDGSGPDTANDDDHVGIVSRASRGGTLKAIEGNTSGASGSQANGDGVYERTRNLTLVRHVYRPPYAKWTAHLQAAEKARKAAAAQAKAQAAARTRAAKAKLTAKQKAARAAAAAVVAAAALAAGTAATTGNDSPDPGPDPAASASVQSTPPVTSSPAPSLTAAGVRLTRTLAYSPRHTILRGSDVFAVQRIIGFTGAAADRQYGPKTAAGVRKWQRQHGLNDSGRFGRAEAKAAGWVYGQ